MGVEARPSGAVAAGPSVNIVNEGPVGPGFRLENTMPHTIGSFKPVGEIRFNSPVKEFPEGIIPSVFLEAFSQKEQYSEPTTASAPDVIGLSISEAVKPKVIATKEAVPLLVLTAAHTLFPMHAEQAALTGSEVQATPLSAQSEAYSGTEPHSGAEPNLVYTRPQAIPIPSEIVEVEEVEEKIEQSPETLEQTKEMVFKKRYLIDKVVLSRRISGIVDAVKKAAKVAKEGKISGKLISYFWDGQNPGYLSPVVRPGGPDGGIPETKENIEDKEYDSEQEAVEGVVAIVEAKRPVKAGKLNEEGEYAGEAEVGRVFKLRRLFALPKIHEEVIKRVTKKKVPVPVGQAPVEVKSESTLEELNPELAKVF